MLTIPYYIVSIIIVTMFNGSIGLLSNNLQYDLVLFFCAALGTYIL